MKKTTILSFLLLLLLPSVAWRPQDDYSLRYNKWKKQYAEQQIKALKEGALLVRLHTRNKAIELYRNSGNTTVANKIEDEQYQENKAIMAAFNEFFNFAPIFFFFADDTEKIKVGGTRGVFLNHKMLPDTTINPILTFYMVAEFAPLEAETRVIPGDTLVATGDYVASGVLERALLVRDKSFMQMRSPFPYYIRAANKSKAEKPVSRLNEQLQAYFQNVTK